MKLSFKRWLNLVYWVRIEGLTAEERQRVDDLLTGATMEEQAAMPPGAPPWWQPETAISDANMAAAAMLGVGMN